jgi:large repetitive protein
MKYSILLLTLVFGTLFAPTQSIQAQTPSPWVISSQGESHLLPTLQLDWILGEPVSETTVGHGFVFTQGFLQPSENTLTIQIQSNQPVCRGGTLSLSADSIAGATYTWQGPNGFTGNQAWVSRTAFQPADTGLYIVQVSHPTLGQDRDTIAISLGPVPFQLTLSPTSPVNLCPGDSMVLTASGATSYLWSNGATTSSIRVSSAGSWFVTGQDGNGCISAPQVVQVNLRSRPVVALQPAGTISLCNGDSILVRASGAASYLWSQGGTADSSRITTAGTYTVVGQDAFGCSSLPASVTVIGLSSPVFSIQPGGPTSICQGDSVSLMASGGQTYSWNTQQTGNLIFVRQSGTYQVSGTSLNGCSGTSAPINITVRPLPSVSIQLQGPGVICQGGTVVLSAQGASSYLWNNSMTGHSISTTSSGAFSVTGTDSLGCRAVSQPVSVTVNPLPIVSVIPLGPLSFCPGGSVQLVATGAPSYQWSDNSTNPVIQVSSGGTYRVTGYDQNGCSVQTAPLTVTVHAPPVIQVNNSGPLQFCPGGQVMLTATGGVSYLWNTGGTTASIQVQQSGVYQVTGTDVNGCSVTAAPDTVTVINSNLRIDPSGPLTFCQGSSVMLNARGGSQYLWSTGHQTSMLPVISSGTYTLTGIDSSGCGNNNVSVVVVVNPLPVIGILSSGSAHICPGDSVQFTGTGALLYIWNTGDIQQSFRAHTAGTYNVSGIDNNGCVGRSADSIVVIQPAPVLTVTPNGPTRFCQGNQVQLLAGGANSYLWSNGLTTDSIQVNSAGTYYVTGANSFGCSGRSIDIVVTVDTLPVVTILPNGPSVFCSGDSVMLQAQGASSYLWSNGSTMPSVTVYQSNTFSVVGTNTLGCSAVSSAQTVVSQAVPVVSISANRPLFFCQGDSVVLYGQGANNYTWSNGHQGDSLVVYNSGTYSVTGYLMNTCNSVSASVQVDVLPAPQVMISPSGTISVCQGDSVVLRASGASLYVWSNMHTGDSIVVRNNGTFSVTGYDANGCQSISPVVRVGVALLPVVHLQASGPLDFCAGDSVILSVSGTDNYLWSNGNTSNSIKVTQSGTYSVVATNSFGCVRSSVPAIVQVYSLPTVGITASGPLRFCQGDSVVLTAIGSSSYVWSTGSPLSAITVSVAGSYSVTGVSPEGCQGMSSPVVVTVDSVPVILTQPNGSLQVCNGNSIAIQAQGGQSYVWSTGQTSNPLSVSSAGTYRVTGTDANGCSGISPIITLTNYAATVQIQSSGPLSFCTGDSVILAVNTPGSYIWSNGQTTASIQVRATGNYSVSGTDVNGCQVSSAPVSVSVHPLPVVSIAAQGPTNFCQGGQVVLLASGGSSYQWSTGQTGNQITVSQSGQYRVTGFTLFGCADSSTIVSVTVNPTPPVPVVNATQTISRGQTATVTASGSQGVYEWWSSSTGGASLGTGSSYTSGPINSFTYFYVDATFNGCTSARDSVLIVFPEAVLSNSPVCSGSPIYFSVSPLIPYGNVLWSGPNGFSSTAREPGVSSVTLNSAGVYTIQITQGTQVVFFDTVRVVVGQNLVSVAIAGNSPVCVNGTLQLSVPQFSGTTYQWSGPAGFNSTQHQISIPGMTGVQSGRYSFTAQSPGCQARNLTYDVSVIGGNSINPNSNSIVCSGSALYLTAQNPGGGISPVWRGPGNYMQSGYSVARSNTNASMSGIYTFSVSVPGCGIQSVTVPVVVQTDPRNIASSATVTACAGDSIVLHANDVTGVVYQWNGPSGYSSNLHRNTLYSVGQSESGVYILQMSAVGCNSFTRQHNVTVNGWGQLSPSSNSPVCSGGSLQLSCQNPGGAVSYQWQGPMSFVSSGQLPAIYNVTPQRSGEYTLTVGINGCPSRTEIISVVVNSAISSASGWSNSPVCQGGSLSLSATFYPNAVYSWQGPGGFTANIFNPVLPNVQPINSGLYTVSISNPGCSGRIVTIPVQVNQQPLPLGGSNSPVCAGGVVYLTAPSYLGATYSWVYPNGFTAPVINPAISNAQPINSGTYTLRITSPSCQPVVQPVVVSVTGSFNNIHVGANQNPICENSTLILTGSSVSGSNLFWSGPNGFTASGATVSIPSIPVNGSGIYSYQVFSPGCGSTQRTISISVSPSSGINAGILHNPVCQGQPVYFLGQGPPNIAYRWQGPVGFSSFIQNPSINVVQPFQAGIYTVRATVPGCPESVATVQLIVNLCRTADSRSLNHESGSDNLMNVEIEKMNDLKMIVYPNPAQMTTTVKLSSSVSDKAYIKLFDALGHEVLVQGIMVSSDEWHLNVSGLSRGVYWIQLMSGSHILRERLILE